MPPLPTSVFRAAHAPSAPDAPLGERRMRGLPSRPVSSTALSHLSAARAEFDRVPSGASFASASSLSLAMSIPGAEPIPGSFAAPSHAPKRDADAEPEPGAARPSKKRRGLAGALVDGAVTASIVAGAAVFGAYSLWQSWGRKPEDGDASLVQDARTDFMPGQSTPARSLLPAPASASPSASAAAPSPSTPQRAIYISNRRRRTIIPSHRRRHAPLRSTPQRVRPAGLKVQPEVVAPATDEGLAPPEGVSGLAPEEAEEEEEEEDAAFTRMQGRLSAMIAECTTALTAGPEPGEMESSVTEEEERFARSRASLTADHSSLSHRAGSPFASLGATPSLYASPRASSRQSPAPSAFAGPRPPSRIPVPTSPVRASQPPSAATFAFHLRPGSRAAAPARLDSPHDAASSLNPAARHGRGSSVDLRDADRTPRPHPARLPLASPTRSPRRTPASPRPAWR